MASSTQFCGLGLNQNITNYTDLSSGNRVLWSLNPTRPAVLHRKHNACTENECRQGFRNSSILSFLFGSLNVSAGKSPRRCLWYLTRFPSCVGGLRKEVAPTANSTVITAMELQILQLTAIPRKLPTIIPQLPQCNGGMQMALADALPRVWGDLAVWAKWSRVPPQTRVAWLFG